MKSVIFFLLLVSTAKAGLAVCDKVENSAAVNIAFDYSATEVHGLKLSGIDKDRSNLQYLSGLFASHATAINDRDLSTSNPKDYLLSRLKGVAAKTKGPIMINYSGHGVLTDKGTWGMVLPNLKYNCVQQMDTVDHIAQGEFPALHKGIYAMSYLKSKDVKLVVRETTVVPPKQAKPNSVMVHFQYGVFRDDLAICRESMVTAEDLRNAVGTNRKIFGIVDACHSGALTDESNLNVIYSSQTDETSAATPNGSVLLNAVVDIAKNYPCRLADSGGRADISKLGRLLPPVLIPSDQTKVTPVKFERVESIKVASDYQVQMFSNSRFGQRPGFTLTEGSYHEICTDKLIEVDKCISNATRETKVGIDSLRLHDEDPWNPGKICEVPAGTKVKVLGQNSDGSQLEIGFPPGSGCSGVQWVDASKFKSVIAIENANGPTGSTRARH